jgi:hypothetical protein
MNFELPRVLKFEMMYCKAFWGLVLLPYHLGVSQCRSVSVVGSVRVFVREKRGVYVGVCMYILLSIFCNCIVHIFILRLCLAF